MDGGLTMQFAKQRITSLSRQPNGIVEIENNRLAFSQLAFEAGVEAGKNTFLHEHSVEFDGALQVDTALFPCREQRGAAGTTAFEVNPGVKGGVDGRRDFALDPQLSQQRQQLIDPVAAGGAEFGCLC